MGIRFYREKPGAIMQKDVQSEAVSYIINGGKVLPSKRLADAIYLSVLDNRNMTIEDIEALANRLSRLAWERGRR